MENLEKYSIELDKEVYKALVRYCHKRDILIGEFIKNNLIALGEYQD